MTVTMTGFIKPQVNEKISIQNVRKIMNGQ